MQEIKEKLNNLYEFCKNSLELKKDVPYEIVYDDINNYNKGIMGNTGYFDPTEVKIVIFGKGRHPKDILRSLAHEMIHYQQHERGEFNKISEDWSDDYIVKNNHLRKMEEEAYLKGNMIFRDWLENQKISLSETLSFRKLLLYKKLIKRL